MNLHLWRRKAFKELAFSRLLVTLTEITLLDVLKVDGLAGLLEFVNHLLSLTDQFFVLLFFSFSCCG